jgi:hypothetical protein
VISSDDLAQMQNDLADMRADNSVSLVFRRGETTLPAQTVRIARSGGRGSFRSGAASEEARGQVIVTGPTSLDVQVDDRFTYSAVLYRVTFIRPTRTVDTVAEADAVE